MNNDMLSVDDALAYLLGQASAVTEVDNVPTMEAVGRVLARTLVSTLNVPAADNSAMDGYAVCARDCSAAGRRLVVSQRVAAGQVGGPLEPGTAARIFTGAMIPAGADAVIMQENTTQDGDGVIVNKPPQAGDAIRLAAEDIRAGSEILQAGRRLNPVDIGLAASVGFATLPVYRRLRVALFFTGDELVMPGEALPPGAIYNSNRFFLTALVRALGCQVNDLGIVPDSLEQTRETLRSAAAHNDLVITSGGVSVGEEDHLRPAMQAEGSLLMWRIAIKPGKPLAFGQIAKAAFVGLPGNPVSSFVTYAVFVRPFILACQGASASQATVLSLRADFDWPRPDRRREFLRARVNADGGLDLYGNQGSGVLTVVAWADGLIDNPAGQAIKRGDQVAFLPFTSLLQ